eukprot:SAG31_NODE_30096_length_385_cov_1.027972_1_plen_100_part_10
MISYMRNKLLFKSKCVAATLHMFSVKRRCACVREHKRATCHVLQFLGGHTKGRVQCAEYSVDACSVALLAVACDLIDLAPRCLFPRIQRGLRCIRNWATD